MENHSRPEKKDETNLYLGIIHVKTILVPTFIPNNFLNKNLI